MYQQRADRLVELLLSHAKTHPEILTLEDPFDLFKISAELREKINALDISLAQASWALVRVKNHAPR